jgi:hypothetical protein
VQAWAEEAITAANAVAKKAMAAALFFWLRARIDQPFDYKLRPNFEAMLQLIHI